MNIRLLPPSNVKNQTVTLSSGRVYRATPGTVLDAPDFDAPHLEANGWFKVAPSGTTAMRPTVASPVPYTLRDDLWFLDTTLGYMIVYDGAAWRNPSTGAAV